MEQLSLQQLSSPKNEFYEPAPPADPILSTSYELSSGFIALVQENSFSGRDCENLYHHLRKFEQVCSSLKISYMTHETLKWKLFPFSLSEEARQWCIHVVGCVNGSWIELQNRFCSAFFLLSRICALRTEVLTFHQNDKELISVAWAQFNLLVQSGLNLSLPEHLLLQHFYAGLDKGYAHHLDLTSGGSFAYLTPSEGREVLNRILDGTSFVCIHEPIPTEPEMRQEETSEIESEHLESQSIDLTPEPSPELKPETPEEEDHLPPEFLQSIECDFFEDFGNTSRYFYQKRPSVPITPMDPSEENYLHETIQELTALMSNEWLQEGESSLNPIQLNSPSLSFRCHLQDQNMDTLYSPTVGANLMSDKFVLAFLGNQTHSDRQTAQETFRFSYEQLRDTHKRVILAR
jgi:hypothetical protein